MTDTLFLIPARGGSKGVPGKNIKPLGQKPLICYSIDIARKFVSDNLICVSTDDDAISIMVENYGLQIPFKRPAELATDTAGSYEVILSALNYYESQGYNFEKLVLLQPTSPFRLTNHVKEAMELFSLDLDMVVAVKKTNANPYTVLFEENSEGFLVKLKDSQQKIERRQDAPSVYEVNGAVYVMNVNSLKKKSIAQFTKTKKYIMDEVYSVDIDTPLDWLWCEFLLDKKIIQL